MNNSTLIVIAGGAALFFLARKKSPGASPPPSSLGGLAGQARGAVDTLANQALAAIPSRYGFRAPAASPLGGNASGAGVQVDLTKFLKAAGQGIAGLFTRTPAGPHSTQADYRAAVAEENQRQETEDARARLIQGGFPEPAQAVGPNGTVYQDLGGFFAPVSTAEPLGALPGRDFALEDPTPLNTLENSSLYDYNAPVNQGFDDFTTPLESFA